MCVFPGWMETGHAGNCTRPGCVSPTRLPNYRTPANAVPVGVEMNYAGISGVASRGRVIYGFTYSSGYNQASRLIPVTLSNFAALAADGLLLPFLMSQMNWGESPVFLAIVLIGILSMVETRLRGPRSLVKKQTTHFVQKELRKKRTLYLT